MSSFSLWNKGVITGPQKSFTGVICSNLKAMPRLAGGYKAHSARYWGYLKSYRLLSKKSVTYFLQKSPAKQDFTKPCSETPVLDVLQLHCTRGSHISITVFPNVYNRVSVLSVSYVLTGQKLQTSYPFVCCTYSQYFVKKLKQESQLFSPPFPLYTQLLKLCAGLFSLIVKKALYTVQYQTSYGLYMWTYVATFFLFK